MNPLKMFYKHKSSPTARKQPWPKHRWMPCSCFANKNKRCELMICMANTMCPNFETHHAWRRCIERPKMSGLQTVIKLNVFPERPYRWRRFRLSFHWKGPTLPCTDPWELAKELAEWRKPVDNWKSILCDMWTSFRKCTSTLITSLSLYTAN